MQILSSTQAQRTFQSICFSAKMKAQRSLLFWVGGGGGFFFWDIYGWERSEDRISDLYNWRVEWQIKMGSTKGALHACVLVL